MRNKIGASVNAPVPHSPAPPLSGVHVPIMLDEVLAHLRPARGDIAVDCTLGGGGHASAILARLVPGGRLLGLDIDPIELPKTEASLRVAGYGADTFSAHHATFASLQEVLHAEGLVQVDLVFADLGVSAMQMDNPGRGFSWRGVGPLDMRMNPQTGESAAALIARVDEASLAEILRQYADEPHAVVMAHLLKAHGCATTHAAERVLRTGLHTAVAGLAKADIRMSVRRTFQALRIAVNDEFAALDALLAALPRCLAPGGRVAVITFHSGEDRRVKKAFQAGYRAGIYSAVATRVVQSGKAETFSNRRASAAKLRWAVRAATDAPRAR